MATAIGPFQVGPNLTTLNVTGGTFVNGVFTAGGTYTLTDVVISAGLTHQVRSRNIKPCTVYPMNMVAVETGTFGQIRALKYSIAADKIETIKRLHTHIIVRRTTGRDQRDVYFLLSNFDSPHEGQDEQFSTLDLEPIYLTDVAQDTYTFV